MEFDDGQLSGQTSVDQPGGETIEPGEEALRETDVQFPGIAHQRGDDLAGHVGGAVALARLSAVTASVFIGVSMARGTMCTTDTSVSASSRRRACENARNPALAAE